MIIKHNARKEDGQRVLNLALENTCEIILVGLPLDSEGEIGPRARSVLRFVQELRKISEIPILTWDESGSTKALNALQVEAGISMKRRREPKDDKVAALILQDYFENGLRNSS